MGSRVLGFLRDILIASVLGAGPVADAFFVAFKLPNFLRRLFAEGAFNAAFVPLFAGSLERDGRGGGQVVRGRRSHGPAVDASSAGHRRADRDAVADARAGAGLRRGAGEAGTHRAAHAAHLPLHPADLARLPPRRRAQLALSLRRRRGHADPAQPLPDRGASWPFSLDRDAGARVGYRSYGRRDRGSSSGWSLRRRGRACRSACAGPGSRRG